MKRKKEPRELTKEEVNVIVAVRHCARELGDFLQGARLRAQNDVVLFANSEITSLFRGIESYSDMYHKLGISNRRQLYGLFNKSKDATEILDTQDAIEDIEGLWNNFLSNMDQDLKIKRANLKLNKGIDEFSDRSNRLKLGSTLDLKAVILHDLLNKKDVRLHDLIKDFDSTLVILQPSYMPDTPVRFRYNEIKKLKADLKQFNVNYIVVTWGEKDDVKDWSRTLRRMVDWQILWDKDLNLLRRLSPKNGFDKVHLQAKSLTSGIGQGVTVGTLQLFCRYRISSGEFLYPTHNFSSSSLGGPCLYVVWAWQTLEFCGMNKVTNNWPINPPPSDLNWLQWQWVGVEFLLSKEMIDFTKVVRTRQLTIKQYSAGSSKKTDKSLEIEEQDSSSDEEDKIELSSIGPSLPLPAFTWRVCLLHRSRNLGDVSSMGCIYQAIMSCSAKKRELSELEIIKKIREDRKLTTAPDKSRMERERESGLLYDPITELHLDDKTGYFWNAKQKAYFTWSENDQRYIRADGLIKYAYAKQQTEVFVQKHEELKRNIEESKAARDAAAKVSAQLAALRANKDHYAAYTYSTCIAPQNVFNEDQLFREATQTASAFQNTMNSNFTLANNAPKNNAVSLPSTSLVTIHPEYEEDAPPPGL